MTLALAEAVAFVASVFEGEVTEEKWRKAWILLHDMIDAGEIAQAIESSQTLIRQWWKYRRQPGAVGLTKAEDLMRRRFAEHVYAWNEEKQAREIASKTPDPTIEVAKKKLAAERTKS